MSVYKELGNKLKDFISAKTEEVDDKVEAIDKHERYVNTDLDYAWMTGSKAWITLSGDITKYFDNVTTNLEINSDGHVILKANKKYLIIANITTNTAAGTVSIQINKQNLGTLGYYRSEHQNAATLLVSPTEDSTLSVWVGNNNNVYTAWSYIIIQEIGRQIVIDPLEYVNESQGIEDTPVGHIIAHMGTVAPKHYLICDGTEYNITDYPYLAQHIEDNFGSINFFGGDGETTFAVPDLRERFLKGSDNVGINQDAGLPNISGTICQHGVTSATTIQSISGAFTTDKTLNKYRAGTDKTGANSVGNIIFNASKSSAIYGKSATVTPANTSVLYCIKYEPTYFMNTYNTNYMQPSLYSEEEKVIGCWINGKPLYEKTVHFTTNPINGGDVIIDTIPEIETFINPQGYVLRDVNGENSAFPIPYSASYANIYAYSWYSGEICVGCDGDTTRFSGINNRPACLTFQYTKTTDEPNSFTNSMLKESYIKLDSTCTDEELQQAISDMVEEINAEEVTPEVIDGPETEVTEGGQG